MPMSYLLMFHFIKDLICQCDARVLNQILVNSREGKIHRVWKEMEISFPYTTQWQEGLILQEN